MRQTKNSMAYEFHVYENADLLAAAAAGFIREKINQCLETRTCCHIALPGGRTPAPVLKLLSASTLPWEKINWYVGDERCLPVGDDERNDSMIRQNLFSDAPDRVNNFFPMKAELGAEQAAEDYAAIVDAFEIFDIVILGMGDDGHTASLFPGNAALDDDQRSVVPVHDAPKPPEDRVSLSLKTLTDTRVRIILATGSDKRSAIGKIKAGARLPVTRIGDSDFFIDTAAAG